MTWTKTANIKGERGGQVLEVLVSSSTALVMN